MPTEYLKYFAVELHLYLNETVMNVTVIEEEIVNLTIIPDLHSQGNVFDNIY